MKVDVQTCGDGRTGVVVVHGEIDLSNASRMREALSDHLAQGRCNLLMDLRDVTFIDSTGLGVLIGANKAARSEGGSLRVVCDDARILRLLRITGISKSLSVLATVEEATSDWPGSVSLT
jgi:anti-sigma B factor antagonist